MDKLNKGFEKKNWSTTLVIHSTFEKVKAVQENIQVG